MIMDYSGIVQGDRVMLVTGGRRRAAGLGNSSLQSRIWSANEFSEVTPHET